MAGGLSVHETRCSRIENRSDSLERSRRCGGGARNRETYAENLSELVADYQSRSLIKAVARSPFFGCLAGGIAGFDKQAVELSKFAFGKVRELSTMQGQDGAVEFGEELCAGFRDRQHAVRVGDRNQLC